MKEKIRDDKVIKLGKFCAMLLIALFSVSFITETKFNFTIIFNTGLVFVLLELFSVFINFSKKIGKIINTRNIIFLLILIFILNYINYHNIYYALVAMLFILWFWVFREIIKSRKIRIIVIMIMILIPSIMFGFYEEFYYKIAGKIVKKKIEVSTYDGIEVAQSECENKMSKKCKFIKWEKVVFSDYYTDCKNEGRSDCIACWDCGYYIVNCSYGCPKSYSEQ